MKVLSIVLVFTLCEVVKGWIAMLQPIALSIGAAFAALNSDVNLISDIQPIEWKKWLSSKDEKEDLESDVVTDTEGGFE